MNKAQSQAKHARYAAAAMTAICDLMRNYGVPQAAAERRLLNSLRSSYRRASSSSREAETISMLADVCTRWYIEPEFVDGAGRARPLKWNGRTGELLRLTSAVVGRSNAREIADLLVTRRLVKKTPSGAWLPRSRVVAPVGFKDAQILRSAAMVRRLVRTLIYNSDKHYKGDVLLEVMAQVPRLPKRDIRRFKEFAKAQGLLFAKSVDDWLEARTLRKSRYKLVPAGEVGVVAFAFVE